MRRLLLSSPPGLLPAISHSDWCSGDTARLVSKYRPSVPILTVTRTYSTSRNCHLYRGVYPFLYPKARPEDPKLWQVDVDARLHWAMQLPSTSHHRLTVQARNEAQYFEPRRYGHRNSRLERWPWEFKYSESIFPSSCMTNHSIRSCQSPRCEKALQSSSKARVRNE